MYDFLIWIQGFEKPVLTKYFSFVSDLIAPLPLSVIAIIVYWCISKKKGLALAMSVVTAVTVNTVLKLIFSVPRPFLVDDRIAKMDETEGFSFPSGHSQQAGTLGRFLFGATNKRWLGITLWVLVALTVGFSRMYLGMHTPLDVFCGITLGVVITEAVIAFVNLSDRKNKPCFLHLITVVSGVSMIFTGFDKDLVTMTALSFGAVTGYMIDERFISYNAPSGWKNKILAGLIGLLTVGVCKGLFKLIETESLFVRFTDYAIFGFAITAVAPYLIKKVIKQQEVEPRLKRKGE